MMPSFQDKTEYLKKNGWVERSSISFVKNGYEIFWDTSSAVEVYPENDNTQRLEDVRIETLADLERLTKRLSPIDDWATMNDENAIALIREILQHVTDDLMINKNADALERRYRKPTGWVCQKIFTEGMADPQTILYELKRESRIFL